ncbi:hypothetical protein [Streptomyces sp. NPDC058612]|uniref:hypothetical protein n=1 Tax=Streptomyces sp. NPDC058612 TaxID=3346555 RepID=UPI0036501CAC
MTRKEDQAMIAALLREREGYERRGKEDRVRQVDEQLEHYGYEPKPDLKSKEPEGRTAPPAATADAGTAAAPAEKETPATKPAAARARGAAAKTTGSGGKAEPAKG